MKGYIGITYNDWSVFLSQQPGIDGINFWQPHFVKNSITAPTITLSFAGDYMFPRTSNLSRAPNFLHGTTKTYFGDKPLEEREVT
jgi:hypothetical protein